MQNRIICVIAPKGSGKTHLISNMIPTLEPKRIAVFDMIHERAYSSCVPYVGKMKAFATELKKGDDYQLAYRPIIFENDKGKESVPEFGLFVKACYLKGSMWMVVDEAHQICTARNCPKELLKAIRLGRHRELSMIFITQSFSAISRPITENADEFYFFRIMEPSSIDGISKRCGTDVAEKVQNLRKLKRDINTGNVIETGQVLHWTVWDGIESITE